jgi:RNA-directed DNA polymerase
MPEDEPQGMPQGGVISPLLDNIYLNPLDWLMVGLGFEMARYADDMVVLCQTEEEAKAALEKLREWMDGAGLTLHPDKTRTADLNRPLPGWFGYFKHVKAGQLGEIDGWIRMRLRSILGKRRGLEGRGLGGDHQRWPNRYFKKLGLFCLLDARETEFASLRNGANH